MSVRVRFAPSPTGYLHIGNVRTALFNFLFARKHGGTLILRIEDTDQERSKPEYVQQILEDLTWLGIRWDEGPYEQSKRLNLYGEACDRLVKEGKAYPCFCTPADLEKMKKESLAKGLAPRYDNRCRKLTPQEIDQKIKSGARPAIRFKVDEGELVFEDLIRGTVRFDLSLFGDFVILRPDGVPTFHLAVCLDDGLMKVTHVIRGEDHLSNTPRHILLFRALGFKPPQFAHLALIMGKGGEPLSKRLGAMSIEEYKHAGYLPEVIANYIALLGWSPGDNREIFRLAELEQAFSLERVGHSSSIFDREKLDWLSGEHLRRHTDDDFAKKALEYLRSEGAFPKFLENFPADRLKEILLIFKDNISLFGDLKDRLSIFDPDAEISDTELLNSCGAAEIFTVLRQYLESLSAEEPLNFDILNQKLKASVKVKGKELYLPLRVALTFRGHGPELKRILPYLSRELCLKRLEIAEKKGSSLET